MKKSASVNWLVARICPLRLLMRLMSLRTTTPSAPREKPICAGTATWNCRPYTASTSTVVALAAILPLLRADQLSSSLRVIFSLKPWSLKKTEFSVGSSPPLAAMRPE
jgi:hypothetical protein